MNEDFEQRLRNASFRQIPENWRRDVLARTVPAERPRTSAISNFKFQISNLLWPHPTAWAGVAAVWVGILCLHVAAGSSSFRAPERRSAGTRPSMAAMLDQKKILIELLSDQFPLPAALPAMEPGRRPRSDRRSLTVIV